MKTRIAKFFAAAIVLFAFSASAFSQVSATATAAATIITPISITKTGDMNFGNVAVNAAGGTVVLLPAGTRSATLGVTLPAAAGTVSAATFDVAGSGTSTYSIAIAPASILITSGGNSMSVGTFTSTPSGTGALTAGAQTINVGATLNVGGSQPSGSYTTPVGNEFTVTVNYN
jgi:hypothetical protein